MKWLSKLKIMPLLIVFAALSFGVRFGDFVTGISSAPRPAQAQAVENKNVSTPEDLASAVDEVIETTPTAPAVNNEEPKAVSMASEAQSEGQENNWKDSSDSDLEFSEVRMELFEDLSARRKDLQSRERELAVREALLKAAEQEIEQKYKELVSLRSEIQDLLVKQTEEEKLRTASLVKIYEGMKPKDAARIFNTLDLDVLLQVVSEMSERKSAPVIASMMPDRARTLTMMLMEQKSLPTLSEDMVQ